MTETPNQLAALDGDVSGLLLVAVEIIDDNALLFRLSLKNSDPDMSQPGMFGIVLSDLVDHIALAYHQASGLDVRAVRREIVKVMADEERLKKSDPGRAPARGKTSFSWKH